MRIPGGDTALLGLAPFDAALEAALKSVERVALRNGYGGLT